MYKFGLKLFSTNKNYIKDAIKYHKEGLYDYIEVYVVPGSYADYVKIWKELEIKFIIHAPHFKDGLNFAKKDLETFNMKLVDETLRFADELNADKIIFHPGVDGDTRETARQMDMINDKRVLVENKPYYALNENLICNGNSPEEIKYILENARIGGFCLDFGHAICAANGKKIKPFEFIDEFLKLNPAMFHLTDGDFNGVYDRHDHFGRGSFPISRLLSLVPEDKRITNEAIKDSKENLEDFALEMREIRELAREVLNRKVTK